MIFPISDVLYHAYTANNWTGLEDNPQEFYNDFSYRLKLPLIKCYPLYDALISAFDGQQTEEENEILRHYLTPLGIGGI